MAIDDNTSYELTGYQVKDLAQKIRAKADASAISAVGYSNLYSDLTGTPSIPTVYNGTLTITQGGNTLGTFTANSSTDVTIDVPAGGSSYTAGTGIDIDSDNEISVDTTVVATQTDLAGKQDTLTAGTNITISNNTISATDTTYSAFTGATSSVAGTSGLVPAPAAGDDTKFLKGDGTWATVQAGGTVTTFYWNGSTSTMYKDSGYSTVATMSDVETAASAGLVKIYLASFGRYEYLVSDEINNGDYFSTVWATANGNLRSVVYTYSSNTWSRTAVNIQKELTAGTNISIGYDNTISATDTTYSNFTGATGSVAGSNGLVPAPAAGDQEKVLHGDGTWKDTTAKLVEMSYGESNAWAKFIAAYNAGSIVYCRASSNANPATGSQTRKAFMAYVNNATSPTNVEFQYVRSQSSKTDSQQCDQVFVYTLTNASGGTWSVASRNMAPKINVSGPITKTFTSGANATITIGADAMTGATASTAGAAGVVPAPASGDNEKFLRGDGTWQTVGGGGGGATTFYWFSSFDPVSGNAYYDLFTDDGHTVVASDSDVLDAVNSGGALIYDEDAGVINTVISIYFTGESFITIDTNGTKEYSYNGIPLPGHATWTRS